MPTITSLETQQNDPERINVYLDGKFGFGAARLVVLTHHLSEGQEIAEEEVEALRREDALERSYAAALNYLSFRPRSSREIEDYFRRRKFDPEVTPLVLERLERLGLVDDREFARFWVENRQTFRPRGSRALRMEMRQKGVASEVIDEALEELGDEESASLDAARRKMLSFANLDEREFKRKMVAYLQRRGFPYDVAATATRKLAQERGLSGDFGDTDES